MYKVTMTLAHTEGVDDGLGPADERAKWDAVDYDGFDLEGAARADQRA
jgi:hypothetical protein